MSLRQIRGSSWHVSAGISGVALLLATTVVGCNAPTESSTPIDSSSSNNATFSFTIAPSSVTVSPGGSALAIGTIRGASGLALSFLVGTLPNGVSVRVTSDTDVGGVTTKKLIVFADAATVPGTYSVGIRLSAIGRQDIEAPLNLVVVR